MDQDLRLIPTPPPQSFVIELGHQTLTVPDLSKPLWHGTYYTGKLSIYEATVTGEVLPKSKTYVTTFTEHDGPEFMVYTAYQEDVAVNEIVTHLQKTVFDSYQKTLEDSHNYSFISAESKTVH